MKKKTLIIVGGVVIALGVGAFAMNRAQTPDGMAMMGGMNTVVTSRVHRGDIRQSITANGMVALERIEPIFSSAQGETRLRVDEVLVDVGDYVEVGQPIVTYDVEDTLNTLNRQIRESEINLENQRLSLRELTMGPSEQEHRMLRERVYSAQEGLISAENTLNDTNNLLDPTRRAIEDAQRAYELAQTEFNVNQQIFTLGGITRDALEQSAQAVESSRQGLRDAQHTLDNLFLTIETRERSLEEARRNLSNEELNYSNNTNPLSTESAQIANTRALNNLELAQSAHNSLLEQRDRLVSETTSHTSGMVTSVEVTVGEQVTGTSVLVEIADFSNLIVTAEIREVDAPNVSLGQSVSMTSAGLAGTVYMGTITRVSPTAISRQAQMGMEIVVPIEITVENPDEHLRPGYSVDIEIILVESLDTVSISLMSILQDFETGQEYVFVIDDNDTLRRRDITRGITTALESEIIEGLESGDRIILTPTPMMQDGDPLPDDAVEVGSGMPGMGMPGGGATQQGGGVNVRVGGGGGGAVVIRH